MPLDLAKLRHELARIRRPRSATITLTPGGPPVEVRPGDELEISYEGEGRRVLAIMPWGLRCWDQDRSATRSFRFGKIGAEEPPQQTDAAASG